MSGAEVSAAGVEIEVPLEVSRERAWQGLTEEIAEWWPREFYVTPSPRFVLELHVGGRLFEDTGDGTGFLWFHVTQITPPERLSLVGCIAPPYGGPMHSQVFLRLEETESGCVLRLTDHLFGVLRESDDLEAGWRQVFGKNFKEHLER